MRQTLFDELTKLNPDKDWSFVTRQIGMFSFTGGARACMCGPLTFQPACRFGGACLLVIHAGTTNMLCKRCRAGIAGVRLFLRNSLSILCVHAQAFHRRRSAPIMLLASQPDICSNKP